MNIAPFVFSILFYGCDVFVYHVSSAVHLSSSSVFSMLWLLWYVHCLTELKVVRQIILAVGLSVLLSAHGAYGFIETLVMLCMMGVWAQMYHSLFVIAQPGQRRFFVLLTFFISIGIMHLKVALTVDQPWIQLMQPRIFILFSLNAILYLGIGENVFLSIEKWIHRWHGRRDVYV